MPELCESGAARVVLDLDVQSDAVAHPVAEGNVAERNVHRAERDPAFMVDPGRDAKADRFDAVLREREHLVGKRLEQRRLRGGDRGTLDRLVHLTVGIDDSCENLRSADVHADDALGAHTRWVTSPPEWP